MIKEERGWKNKAKQNCQEIISRAIDNIPLPRGDAKFIAELLDRHPNAKVKKGCGVAWFTVATEARYHTRHFVVVRTDGSRTDFSFYESITPSSHVQKVRGALRDIVAPQIIAYKDSCVPIECEFNANHRGPFHVDHSGPTFIEIADRFAAYKGGYENIELSPHQDGDIGDYLYDQDDAEFWSHGHQVIARLRILCQSCNLRRK